MPGVDGIRGAARRLGESPRARLGRLAAEYLQELRAANRSIGTISFYAPRLARMLSSEEVCRSFLEADPRPFRAWLLRLKDQGTGGMGRPVSDVYVEGHRRAASAFCGWLVSEGHLRRSPLERVRKWKVDEKEMAVLSPAEIRALFATQPLRSFEGQRNRAAMALLYGTGIRVGELVKVELRDLDLAGAHLRVRGKTRREREVPLSARLRAILRFYLERVRPASLTQRLFVSAEGLPLSEVSLNHWLARAGAKAAVRKRVSPHVWRHTFATEYLRRGGDPLRLQKILGHTTLKMVMRYVHFVQADIDRGIDELSPLDAIDEE